MMVAVALLAIALASAAGQRNTVAILVAGACAAVAIVGLLVFESTARADRIRHHEKPHLLSDSYVPAPPWARRARALRRAGGRGR
ncbi:hypothetical protein [Nocardia macrotermitis]|uniref:Uncharacterized protein n=1 Tax=Nocardia macrotermitis TaxID=2585198 RepID=A0A7K0CX51_9NOCA|nr:hypothetical protein [Nocardia macrotermitis]MQY17234.1 hypothetical protein [Nocardia macrotermitis]